MTVAELIEMILGERIAAILSQTSSEKDVLEKGEMVLNELPEEQGAVIKDYLDPVSYTHLKIGREPSGETVISCSCQMMRGTESQVLLVQIP